MPTEEEIEDIIKSVRSIGPYHAGVKEAAHAIHEHLAGRVVWEKMVQIDDDPDNPNDLAGWSEEDDGDYVVYILGDQGDIVPGQEYRVTVTKCSGHPETVDSAEQEGVEDADRGRD